MYTSQILDQINPSSGTTKVLALKEGDMFTTSVKILILHYHNN